MTKPEEMMKLGADLVAHCNAHDEAAFQQKHYARDAVSVEAVPMPDGNAEAKGLDAIRGKGEWWYGAHEVHSSKAEGPFVNGDQFHVIFDMDVTHRESGQRTQMREIGTYKVKGGKIVREEFAYPLG